VAETHPHITVAHHDQHGVVAAASHGNHVADHMLRLVGFECLPGSSLYALTEPGRDLTRRAQQAVQSLRAAQYSVTSDAAYDVDPATQPISGHALRDRLENTPGRDVSDMGEVAFAASRVPDADIRSEQIPTPATQQRRAQAATAVSPARASASVSHRSAVSVDHRLVSTARQPARAR
jgi:hypothetical protein